MMMIMMMIMMMMMMSMMILMMMRMGAGGYSPLVQNLSESLDFCFIHCLQCFVQLLSYLRGCKEGNLSDNFAFVPQKLPPTVPLGRS